MAISGSHTVEMTDTAFSGAAVQYDTDLEGVPGKFGESFENPLYNDVVSEECLQWSSIVCQA